MSWLTTVSNKLVDHRHSLGYDAEENKKPVYAKMDVKYIGAVLGAGTLPLPLLDIPGRQGELL